MDNVAQVKVLAILQARTGSSRLPGKVLKPILGVPMLARQIERLRRARSIDRLVVATSTDPSDDALARMCQDAGVEVCRGPLDDVLERFLLAAEPYGPEWIVRLTGDCPVADPEVIDAAVHQALTGDYDYVSNTIEPTYPDGLDVEVVRADVLEMARREAKLGSEREHVTPFVHKQPERFRLGQIKNTQNLSHLRWTVDEPQDFELIARFYELLYPQNPDFRQQDILNLLARQPELAEFNTAVARNEGYTKSLQKDASMKNSSRYSASEVLLERATRSIPLGSQTFSKSKTQFPFGVSPFFMTRARGSRVWDADGNEYIDFINSLCSVTLGYSDPDVDAAVRAQLEDGIIFSLPHPIEMQVAEAIIDMVPCAEMVRFGKNGSDATAGAVRLARAFTGRDRVAVCGYHGWQDWYIGSTLRNRGVPQATRDLTHTFVYNDLNSLDALLKSRKDEFACIVMEPMNVAYPQPGFLEGVKEMAHRHGALLVFDETITGFRYANGGAQQLFGVTPDLATFGKGLANGYPVSAVTGRADVMKLMEEIFFSFTFGGETLSLAAALATMAKLKREPVTETLRQRGEKVMNGVNAMIAKHGIGDFVSIGGHPSWSLMAFKDAAPYTQWQIKTLYMQEIQARGFLSFGSHNMSYAHSETDVAALLACYEEVFALLADGVRNGSLEAKLRCKPIEPLFRVR